MISLCSDWEFTPEWSEGFMRGEGEAERVCLPHNPHTLPLHYCGPEDYEALCGYRQRLFVTNSSRSKRLFLQFDGAAQHAWVYVNGALAAEHKCGYTAFRVEITELVDFGAENLIALKLDSHEDAALPPFGFVIDYLTYSGLYREAWLDIRDENYIEDIYVSTEGRTARVSYGVSGESQGATVRIFDGERLMAESQGTEKTRLISIPEARLWDIDSPKLYSCEVTLDSGDTQRVSFSFRDIEFRADGFYLNGRRVFMRGLNRHQSYPYMGYAAPESLQREDARILKEELCCNAVRTSHYPQSQYFIDECDRLGLLVFTELPGWQHLGDEKWKEQACENLREMILQYRNHPSIVLWGVRINESVDDDELYTRTNKIAHELDPYRPTSGVRYLEKSSLLEDVYAYNDFSHTGNNPGVKPKKSVTPDMSRALIVSEHNGHMFPTKSFDTWRQRQEQALRHARVLNDAAADGAHAGCFGWCMFDYQTHKDFGSGDRICYHGVMDAFRNPKTAAALYASQGSEKPVLELGCTMDIGDYPAGQTGDIYAFTNADELRLYKNDDYVGSFSSKGFEGLLHGPVLIDDTIGRLLEEKEGFSPEKAKALRRCLVSAGKHGLANMPLGDKLRMLACMLKYKLSMADGVALYGKYVGNWGGEATRWRFEGWKNGEKTCEMLCAPGKRLHLELTPSTLRLSERQSWDAAAVRIRIADEQGNTASYAQLPVRLSISGDAELVGPETVTAEGGMCGTYIRSTGKAGMARLVVSTPQTESAELEFEIIKENYI